ncbi:MAG TPA: PIN domain-containing protein [Thermoanaerobaculia bacterium]|nr:PIN domain-containing protein [Thermoanaerobaculia bacterium]
MVLVDSSLWIAVERGYVDFLDLVPPTEEIAICPIVVLEVMRGTTPERHRKMLRLLLRATMLDSPTPLERFEAAVELFVRCRNEGITPSTPDSLIAACAIAHDVPLLHDDSDFDRIAAVTSLKLVTRS